MSTKREESKPNQNMYVITKFFSTGASNNEIKKKEDEKNNNLMDGYYSNALNKKKNLNSKKDTKNKNTNNSDSEENESNAKSNSKHIKKLPENKSTKSKSASSAKTKNKPLNSISNQPSLQEFDLRQKELKYKQQLNENQKYLEKINEFKEKMTKRSEKDIADELPSLDLGDNDESNESNDKTLNENKSEEEEEDDREKFISYFETLKRKQLKSESSDTSSVITVGDSQTSLSSQDSDLYIVDDEDSPIEKAIQFAKSYVVNNAQFDKNNNVSAQIKCIKRDKEMEINIIKTEKLNMLDDEKIQYLILRNINYFMNIFTGYEPSWRHEEFKKQTRKSSIELYSNVTFRNFKHEQFVFIVNLFQSIFCKSNSINNKKYEEYIFKVLLPEALIKMCTFLYDCDNETAEKYLQNVRN